MLLSMYMWSLVTASLKQQSLMETDNFELYTSALTAAIFYGNKTLLDEEFPANINAGDKMRIVYTVTVHDRNSGRLMCEEPLRATNVEVDNPSRFLTKSLYEVSIGYTTPGAFVPSNPLYFVPWYAGEASITMEGYGCIQFHPAPFTLVTTVNIVNPDITVNMGKTRCPPKPTIFNGLLIWDSQDDPDGCVIQFDIRNTLSRPASFGVVNLLTSTKNYFITEDKEVFFVEADRWILDDAVDGNGQPIIARPTTDGDLPIGAMSSLRFVDSPSTTLGKACWKSPNSGGKIKSIGYILSFETFVLQDWDKGPESQHVQMPTGGNGLVAWTLFAHADYNQDTRKWSVNNDKSRLEGPGPNPSIVEHNPLYRGFIGSGEFTKGKLDPDTGCYVLEKDPAVLREGLRKRTWLAYAKAWLDRKR